MLRRLALVALVLCALPSSALAAPSYSIQVAAEGVPGNFPAKVTHRLAITAGATAETVSIATFGTLSVSGTGVSVGEQHGSGPSVFQCEGRWERPHTALTNSGTFATDLTIAPSATAFVDTVRAFIGAPWASEDLDAVWAVTPAGGQAIDITSTAPAYRGRRGVELGFTVSRRAPRVYGFGGVTDTSLDSGRVQLWGYAPGAKTAKRLATARLSDGAWSVPRLRLPKTGRWEFYARFISGSRAYADDASVCGTVMGIR